MVIWWFCGCYFKGYEIGIPKLVKFIKTADLSLQGKQISGNYRQLISCWTSCYRPLYIVSMIAWVTQKLNVLLKSVKKIRLSYSFVSLFRENSSTLHLVFVPVFPPWKLLWNVQEEKCYLNSLLFENSWSISRIKYVQCCFLKLTGNILLYYSELTFTFFHLEFARDNLDFLWKWPSLMSRVFC